MEKHQDNTRNVCRHSLSATGCHLGSFCPFTHFSQGSIARERRKSVESGNIVRWFWRENTAQYTTSMNKWMSFSPEFEAQLEDEFLADPHATITLGGKYRMCFATMYMSQATDGGARRCVQRVVCALEPRWFRCVPGGGVAAYDPPISQTIEYEYVSGSRSLLGLRLFGKAVQMNLETMQCKDLVERCVDTLQRQPISLSNASAPSNPYGPPVLDQRGLYASEADAALHPSDNPGPAAAIQYAPATLNTELAARGPTKRCDSVSCWERSSIDHLWEFQHPCPNGRLCFLLGTEGDRQAVHALLFHHNSSSEATPVPPESIDWRRNQPFSRQFRSSWVNQAMPLQMKDVHIGSEEGTRILSWIDFPIVEHFPRIQRVQNGTAWSRYLRRRNEMQLGALAIDPIEAKQDERTHFFCVPQDQLFELVEARRNVVELFPTASAAVRAATEATDEHPHEAAGQDELALVVALVYYASVAKSPSPVDEVVPPVRDDVVTTSPITCVFYDAASAPGSDAVVLYDACQWYPMYVISLKTQKAAKMALEASQLGLHGMDKSMADTEGVRSRPASAISFSTDVEL